MCESLTGNIMHHSNISELPNVNDQQICLSSKLEFGLFRTAAMWVSLIIINLEIIKSSTMCEGRYDEAIQRRIRDHHHHLTLTPTPDFIVKVSQ